MVTGTLGFHARVQLPDVLRNISVTWDDVLMLLSVTLKKMPKCSLQVDNLKIDHNVWRRAVTVCEQCKTFKIHATAKTRRIAR